MPLSKEKATERFVLTLEMLFNRWLTEEQSVRLEGAFNDAVDARVEKALAEARRED